MEDFRNDCYKNYVSHFKTFEGNTQSAPQKSTWQLYEHKYFKHLEHLNAADAVLEVGCGPGDFLAYLAQKGFAGASGIDVSNEQINLARKTGLRVECADVFAHLGLAREKYQAIIAIDFVEHFTKEEVLRLFRAINRALRPEGVLLIQTPNGEGLFSRQVMYGDLTHCTIFTPNSLAQTLRLCGFDSIVFDETGPVSKNLKGCIRLFLWKATKWAANLFRLIEAGKRQQVWTENLICVCRKPA